MAHFAKLDENNIVTQVTVVNNNALLTENNTESEQKGKELLNELFGGTWIQTSYNGKIRKKFASIGDTYDEINDVFIIPKMHDNWILDENFDYVPPVPYPDSTQGFLWNQEENTWESYATPYPSWVWDNDVKDYVPPVQRPMNLDGAVMWNEETTSWVVITE